MHARMTHAHKHTQACTHAPTHAHTNTHTKEERSIIDENRPIDGLPLASQKYKGDKIRSYKVAVLVVLILCFF